MKILLLAMPDAANNFHRIIKVPNLGLCSIAAQLKLHEVKVVDLVLVHRNIQAWLQRFLHDFRPDVIGISSMSFQYESALRVMSICRTFLPHTTLVLGGYHATLSYRELTHDSPPFDFLLRGEGEQSFPALLEALDGQRTLFDVPGLSWRHNGAFIHNTAGPLLDVARLPLPERDARVLDGFTYFDRKLDCVETSRGCTMTCTFCSITGMYGTSFRCYGIERVIADLKELQKRGTRTVLLVDDNITLDSQRFTSLARAIVEHGLNSMEYLVQASVAGIVADPELIPALARANFAMVFLGIESVLPQNLALFQKGDIREKTERAVRLLRQHGIGVMGGFIIGNPDDGPEEIREVFRASRRLGIDLPYVQCVTPYPGTRIREELLEAGLVTNPDRLSRYTGFMCNVRTKRLSVGQLNRIMNWENLKAFFSPSMFIGNYFVRKREKGALKVLLNNLDLVRGFFTGDQFRSRHRF
ncbi:B12-binding domain-containing radical SAM protein [Geomonas subterranea]|uniref:B12-binding domain-containing radical SAM protein n=1 Tax=Geomonas subterranea TaxID=2847989 RepID=A0ABX8LGP8_9BACT|nr:radical SAM protein [Geomonas subterranea]QXE90857.1 B12-binding domain-containing radical SAM protein [Geomonas subterranea]QXM11058.1 B12-binding domain-containing radical SAM protein [Geomonas subterranea]